jgi:hypothetical protein
MAIQNDTLLINAHLVGLPQRLYAVLITNGKIRSISPGSGLPEGEWSRAQVVDCKQADGSSLWVSPVGRISEQPAGSSKS